MDTPEDQPPKRQLTAAELDQRRRARLRHGVFASHPDNTRKRDYRAGRLLRQLQASMGEGWPEPADLPIVKLYCRFAVLADDAISASQDMPENEKLADRALAAGRVALMYAKELGLTSAERGHERASDFYAQ